jgi:hypothetical protein
MDMTKFLRVMSLIGQWIIYRESIAEPGRYLQLKQDLYNVRNDVKDDPIKDSKGATVPYPTYLIDPDNEVMASIEHYFLCRGWVGNGVYNATQMRALAAVYNAGKKAGVTPRHNPSKPVSPPSAMQARFQEAGIADGQNDLIKSGKPAPGFKKPPTY